MKKFLKETYGYIIIIVAVIIVRTFIITPVVVDGPSMEDTLYDNELLLLNKISYSFQDIKRYDIIVIEEGNEKIIKRVYGLPGEKIEYKNIIQSQILLFTELANGFIETVSKTIKIAAKTSFIWGSIINLPLCSRYIFIPRKATQRIRKNQITGFFKKSAHNHYLIKSFITSPAIIIPATGGTKDILAGTGLPAVPFLSSKQFW